MFCLLTIFFIIAWIFIYKSIIIKRNKRILENMEKEMSKQDIVDLFGHEINLNTSEAVV